VAQRFLAAGGLATWLRTLDVAEAIVLRPDHWWGAMATALARIPTRVGYGHPELRPLLTRALPPPGREHAVVSALRLVGAAPAILAAGPGVPPTRFTVGCRPEGDVLAGRFAGKPYAVVHPGASSPMKRWPANRWAAVADALADRGLPVVLAAGPGEGTEIDAIRRAARRSHAVFAPAPSLDRLAALLAGARLALGVDSAPMHLATAVGTPTVRIFGPGDETLYGPWGDPGDHRVVRAPGTRPDPSWFGLTGGSHATLLAVTVDQVLAGLPAR
jgi:ADP-heptose:LPS heptosyltransferase